MPKRDFGQSSDYHWQSGPGQQAHDRFGEEMAENACIWKVYVDEASRYDGTMLKDWNSSIDTLLIFAGLFSAVSTAFIVEAYRLMQPDYTELAFHALMANATHPFVPAPFEVSGTARTVNCLWTASLIASLFTALVGILAKQWLSAYTSDRMGGSLRQWAQLRQFRFDSVRQWRVPEMIALLPVLLHASLLLFLAGLVLFLAPIDLLTALLAFALSSVVYFTYAATTFSPLVWPSSPFRSQLTPIMQQCWKLVISLARRCQDDVSSDDIWKSIPQQDEPRTLAAALSWLSSTTRSPDMFTALLKALGDVNLGRPTAQNLPPAVRQSILDTINAETHYDRLHKTRIPTERLSRYFRAVSNIVTSDDEASHIGSQFAHALVKRATSDSLDVARTPELGDIAIHGLLYIRRFALYISADWRTALVSMTATFKVGKATALAVVAALREQRHDSWEKQLEILLWIVHHFLPHYEAKPDVVVDCIRRLLPVETLPDLERHGHGLIALLCFILTCEHAAIQKLIRNADGLEAAIVSSLIALCAGNDAHNHRFASLANVFACERRARLHSWSCDDIASTVDSIDIHGAGEAEAAQAVANLLHPSLQWHRTATASASQSAALGRCAEAIQLILMMHKTKPSIVLVLDHLLSNAVFVPMSRAAGHSVPALPRVMLQVASTFQSLQSNCMHADNLLDKFIAIEISSGDGDCAQWDIVTAATYACVQAMDGTPKPNPHLFKALISSFASLHTMSSSHSCWLSIARSLHAELTPERKQSLEKAKSNHKSWGPAALDYAAVLESFNEAVGFSPKRDEAAYGVQQIPTPPPTPSKRACSAMIATVA